MPTISLNGITYFYEQAGTGYPLLMLHGFTGSSANWAQMIPALRERYTLIMPDLVGHGMTDKPANQARYTMQHTCADLSALLDALQIERCGLLGYSMGGRTALSLAVNAPARIDALLLESASPGLRTQVERAARRQSDDALANKIEQKGIPWFVDFWESLALWNSQAQLADATRAQLREGRLRNDATGLANSLRGMGTGVMPPLWDALADLPMPVQLVAGALDDKYVALNREMVAQLPDARLNIVADAGHTVHLEQPDTYIALLKAFFLK